MPDIKPLTLPSLTAAGLALSNQLARKSGTALDVPTIDGSSAYLLSPLVPAIEETVAVTLDVDGRLVRLGLGRQLMGVLCDPLVPIDEYPGLPETLQTAILEAALAGALERFSAATGLSAEVREAPAAEPGADCSFGVRPASTGSQCCATLSFEATSLELIHAVLERIPDGVAADFEALPFHCRAHIARLAVALETLSNLEVSDLIVLRGSPFTDGQSLIVEIEGGGWYSGRHENGTVTIQDIEEETMSEDQPENSVEPAATAADVDELSVELQFELGRTTLTLAELKTLQPGFSFDLGRTLPEAVAIRANGKQIGSGELVEIDGQLGVRVTQLFGARHG